MPLSLPALQPHMDSATALVSRVVACAARKNRSLTDDEAELLETYLAAHFYQASDPGYSSRSTLNKSGSFHTPKNQTRYLDRALTLDHSGCLRQLFLKKSVGAFWGGVTEDQATSFEGRN